MIDHKCVPGVDRRRESSGLRFEQVSKCPVCECTAVATRMNLTDYLHGIPGIFGYSACDKCGTVYQDPRVVDEDLSKCYPNEYYTHASPQSDNRIFSDNRSWRQLLRRAILERASGSEDNSQVSSWTLLVAGRALGLAGPIRRRACYGLPDSVLPFGPRPRRCLEVGPGQGQTLLNLSRIGWEAVGLDLDALAARNAETFSRRPVHVGTLGSCPFPAKHFRLIYMNHVFEHIPDIRLALERCYEMLEPGGRLVLIYPNCQSLGSIRHGEFSPNWDPPRHLVLPPQSAVKRLLREKGFNRVRVRSTARRAGGYRAVARFYLLGKSETGEKVRLLLTDRLFTLWETLLVAGGASVGEEIIVVAEKKGS